MQHVARKFVVGLIAIAAFALFGAIGWLVGLLIVGAINLIDYILPPFTLNYIAWAIIGLACVYLLGLIMDPE